MTSRAIIFRASDTPGRHNAGARFEEFTRGEAHDFIERSYKVGHHASHNATLRDMGLEMMNNLELALIPTDAKMAEKVKWGTLPWGPLLTRLAERSKNGVIRTDVSHANLPGVRESPLFHEVTL